MTVEVRGKGTGAGTTVSPSTAYLQTASLGARGWTPLRMNDCFASGWMQQAIHDCL
jgi:hypothetical protein